MSMHEFDFKHGSSLRFYPPEYSYPWAKKKQTHFKVKVKASFTHKTPPERTTWDVNFFKSAARRSLVMFPPALKHFFLESKKAETSITFPDWRPHCLSAASVLASNRLPLHQTRLLLQSAAAAAAAGGVRRRVWSASSKVDCDFPKKTKRRIFSAFWGWWVEMDWMTRQEMFHSLGISEQTFRVCSVYERKFSGSLFPSCAVCPQW